MDMIFSHGELVMIWKEMIIVTRRIRKVPMGVNNWFRLLTSRAPSVPPPVGEMSAVIPSKLRRVNDDPIRKRRLGDTSLKPRK